MTKRIVDIIEWRDFGPGPVIGVDEVGRGCLAGPVVAAAVCFREECDETLFCDSKALSEIRREKLFDQILAAHDVGIGLATREEIDELNILWASMLAMKRAIDGLKHKAAHVLIDGNQRIPDLSHTFRQTTVIKGDQKVRLISAASIVAKVHRDRLMKELGGKYPGYGFEIHKGYATAMHREALQKLGPCHEHRRSFKWTDGSAAGPEL